ncbi:peptide chain release factor N(5)-glutamine methyltransferase [bacterium]|nr:peptide chain release factor N(5)-glutamine methyltransferase [bacterium]
MNLKEALYHIQQNLGNFLEAEILLKSYLGFERQDIYLHPDRGLTRYKLNLLKEAIEKRKAHLPLAYITGKKEFYSLEFRVTPDTFIPRPETEFIVDAVLERLKSKVQSPKPKVNIIDLGTGCGNIAIALARHILHPRIYATDISKKALAVAEENARKHRAEDRITFLQGDLFSSLKDRHLEGKIDFLVSNPPYVIRSEIDSLTPEVADYEPRIALNGGEDGLSFYRRIIEEAPQYLKSPGYLVLELGIDQAPQVKEIVEKTLKFKSIEIIKDYSEIERVIIAQRS